GTLQCCSTQSVPRKPRVCSGSKSRARSSAPTRDRRQAVTGGRSLGRGALGGGVLLGALLAELVLRHGPAHLGQSRRRQADLVGEPVEAALVGGRRLG